MPPLTTSIIGAGNMGHGLAIQFADHNHDVTLIDHKESNLTDAETRISTTLEFLEVEDVLESSSASIRDRITFTTRLSDPVSRSDLVLETVTEDLDIKQSIFSSLEDHAHSEALLATNTSGIPITDIAADLSIADRIVGCHWWYPPYLLRPVEIVRGTNTTQETIDSLATIITDIDRDPIFVEKDVPGFVWNRVQSAVMRECLHIVSRGIASAEDVNKAIRDGYATRTAAIGPLETIDIAGLDLFKTVLDDISPALCNDTEANPLLTEYIEAGRTGIDDGEGFFSYSSTPEAITRQRDEQIIEIQRARTDSSST
jgi:3-hydroxyacyl-CoA dehydrogenase